MVLFVVAFVLLTDLLRLVEVVVDIALCSKGEILWSDLIQSHGKAYRLKTP